MLHRQHDSIVQPPLSVAAHRHQTTLKQSLFFEGATLFSGRRASCSIHPAPPNHGIVFVRTDQNNVQIRASSYNVVATPRTTILGEKGVTIKLVEHLLATLYARGIDNALIKCDGDEIPIFDGSARFFCSLFEECVTYEEKIPIWRVQSPIALEHANAYLIFLPSDELKISYTFDYTKSGGCDSEFYACSVSFDSFSREIAPARTFSTLEEIRPFIENGLLKGVSLDHGLVFENKRVLNPDGLRFPNERVRHKILDLIGDLSLFGFPLFAHIISLRSGHSINTEAARIIERHQVLESQKKEEAWNLNQ